jgi:hypothetical protein
MLPQGAAVYSHALGQQQVGKQGLLPPVVERCHHLVIESELEVTKKLKLESWHR